MLLTENKYDTCNYDTPKYDYSEYFYCSLCTAAYMPDFLNRTEEFTGGAHPPASPLRF